MIEFLVLTVSSAIALAYATPKQVSALRQAGVAFAMQDRLAVLQGTILSTIAAGLGVALRGFTGVSLLNPPGFIRTTLAVTLIGFLGHLFLYHVVFRSRIPRQDVLLAERIRLDMGLPARLVQGGVVEEVQFRWGLMSVLLALMTLIYPSRTDYPILLAILFSALVFALFHLVGARQIGLARSNWEIGLIVVDNIWVGTVFGFLFWEGGMLSAMISHALMHAGWFPFERSAYRRDFAEGGDA
jgi:hypothetical protein